VPCDNSLVILPAYTYRQPLAAPLPPPTTVTGEVVNNRGISWQQTGTAICHSRRPRRQPNCHALWCPVIRRSLLRRMTRPKAWNQLPADIRANDSVNSFKSALKTFLFRWLFV